MAFDPFTAGFSLVESIIDKVFPDPADRLKAKTELKSINKDELLAKLDFKKGMFEAEVADRDSARKREMEVKDNIPGRLAFFILVGFFGMLVTLFFVEAPGGNQQVLYILIGVLGAAVSQTFNYFFGSTRGSREKTLLLAKSDAVKDL